MVTDLDAPVPQDHLLCKIERVTDYDRTHERVRSLISSAHNAPPSRRTSGSIPASQSAKAGKRHEDPPTNIAQMLVGGLLAFSKQKRVPRRVADTQCGACSTCPHNVARSQRPFAACCWYTARSHRSPRSHRPFSPRHKKQSARSARSRLRDLAPFRATFAVPFPADLAVLSVPFPVFRAACRAAFFGWIPLDASLHFRISSRALPASRFASEDPRCPRFCS